MKTNHHIHASTCATSHACHTGSMRFFTKILAAFAVGLFAFVLAATNAEAALNLKDVARRAAREAARKTDDAITKGAGDAVDNAAKKAKERSKKKADKKAEEAKKAEEEDKAKTEAEAEAKAIEAGTAKNPVVTESSPSAPGSKFYAERMLRLDDNGDSGKLVHVPSGDVFIEFKAVEGAGFLVTNHSYQYEAFSVPNGWGDELLRRVRIKDSPQGSKTTKLVDNKTEIIKAMESHATNMAKAYVKQVAKYDARRGWVGKPKGPEVYVERRWIQAHQVKLENGNILEYRPSGEAREFIHAKGYRDDNSFAQEGEGDSGMVWIVRGELMEDGTHGTMTIYTPDSLMITVEGVFHLEPKKRNVPKKVTELSVQDFVTDSHKTCNSTSELPEFARAIMDGVILEVSK